MFYLLSCEINTSLFFLDCIYDKFLSFIPCNISEEDSLYYFKSTNNNSFSRGNTSTSNNCININSVINIKHNISIMFNELKSDTKFAMRKIKVFDRTLS